MADASESGYILPPCPAREPWQRIRVSAHVEEAEAHCGESGKTVHPIDCRTCARNIPKK